jgi:hypothetical protein
MAPNLIQLGNIRLAIGPLLQLPHTCIGSADPGRVTRSFLVCRKGTFQKETYWKHIKFEAQIRKMEAYADCNLRRLALK